MGGRNHSVFVENPLQVYESRARLPLTAFPAPDELPATILLEVERLVQVRRHGAHSEGFHLRHHPLVVHHLAENRPAAARRREATHLEVRDTDPAGLHRTPSAPAERLGLVDRKAEGVDPLQPAARLQDLQRSEWTVGQDEIGLAVGVEIARGGSDVACLLVGILIREVALQAQPTLDRTTYDRSAAGFYLVSLPLHARDG